MLSASRQATRRSSFSTPIGLFADHVLRAGHRKGRDRNAAGERLELHDAERVGPARKHEHVGGGEMSGELAVLPAARGTSRRETAAAARPPAGPSPITTLVPGRSSERNASRFFSTAIAPDADEDRARQIELDGAIGAEQIGVDAARPHAEILKSALAQLRRQRRRRHHGHGRGAHESGAAPHRSSVPGSASAPKCIRETASYSSW